MYMEGKSMARKALLYQCYEKIQTVQEITQESFYDYIIPEIPNITINIEQKKDGIKDIRKLYYRVREFYLNRAKRQTIIKHLNTWCCFVGENVDIILDILLTVFEENQHESTAQNLKDKFSRNENTSMFYEIFWNCMKIDYDIVLEERKSKRDKALQEFDQIVLGAYGLSGKAGKQVVVELAKAGSKNPYILYEAAAILFSRGMDLSLHEKKGIRYLNESYAFYKSASKLEFPLADWDLGHMAQMQFEGKWNIPALCDIQEAKLLNMAIFHYEKAAEQELARAYTSLGNLACNKKVDEPVRSKIGSSKEYYRLAAKHNEVHGLYNYGRILENEICEDLKVHENPIGVWTKKNNKKIQDMFECFEKSAKLGYQLANYRCLLYYSGLTDEKSIPLDKRPNSLFVKSEEKALIYLKRVIDLGNGSPVFEV